MTRNTAKKHYNRKLQKKLYKRSLQKDPKRTLRPLVLLAPPAGPALHAAFLQCIAVDHGQGPQEGDILLEIHFLVFVMVQVQSTPRLWAAQGWRGAQ